MLENETAQLSPAEQADTLQKELIAMFRALVFEKKCLLDWLSKYEEGYIPAAEKAFFLYRPYDPDTHVLGNYAVFIARNLVRIELNLGPVAFER